MPLTDNVHETHQSKSFNAVIYVCAICNVSYFESLVSSPNDGTTSRSLSNATLRCSILLRSLAFAASRRRFNVSFVGGSWRRRREGNTLFEINTSLVLISVSCVLEGCTASFTIICLFLCRTESNVNCGPVCASGLNVKCCVVWNGGLTGVLGVTPGVES